MCTYERNEEINRRLPLGELFQFSHRSAPPSVDCGYFSAMALKLLHQNPGHPDRALVSRRDVYEKREQFERQRRGISTPPLYTHRHEAVYALQPFNAVQFLEFLGLSFYIRIETPGTFNPSNIAHLMADYLGHRTAAILNTRSYGIMFCFLDGTPSGHWAAILGNSGPSGEQNFLIYDSSGVCGLNVALRWTTSSELSTFYGRPAILHVVKPWHS